MPQASPLALIDEPREPAPREHTRWYGWQTLTTDGAALTLLISAAAANRNEDHGEGLAYTSLVVYGLGGPIVHAAHDNWGRAAASLGLRAGLPVVFAMVGAASENCPSSADEEADFCGMGGAALGLTLGFATAIGVDAAALAYDTVYEEPVVMPLASAGKDGAWLGVSGRF